MYLVCSCALFIYVTAYLIPYWLTAWIYYYIDVCSEEYTTIKLFKTQSEKQINYQNYNEAAKVVLRNQIITLPLIPILEMLIKYLGNDMSADNFPSMYRIIKDVLLATCAMDVLFYTAHYYSHSPVIYWRFHKIHHEWTSPVAVSAHYNHWLEHMILNFLIPSVSAVIVGCNFITMWIFCCISTLFVTATHSGYWIASATKHDNHHRYFYCEYGIFVMDYLMGTSR